MADTRDEDEGRVETTLRLVVLVVTTLGLVVAFGYLVVVGGTMLVEQGSVARRGLGAGVLLLVLVGAWATWAIIRNGLELQRISAAAAEAGVELDVTDLPHRPSGRLEREAADALFDEVAAEYQQDPDDWRRAYRLARAYDHAGDRPRARETMRRAADLRAADPRTGGTRAEDGSA